MQGQYDEIVKRTYETCKRLENIVLGIVANLENEQYRKAAPMTKQLSLTSKATGVLASITELAQVLKSEGAEIVKDVPKEQDPRIPALLEKLKKIKELGSN